MESLNDLAQVLRGEGLLEGAAMMFHEALCANQELLGFQHPRTLASMNTMADTLQEMGAFDQALDGIVRQLNDRPITANG